MFKFNFSQVTADVADVTQLPENASSSEKVEVAGLEIKLTDSHRERAQQYKTSCKIESCGISGSSFKLNLVDVKVVEQNILESEDTENYRSLTTALTLNSDVIKGVYEGGLKIWECTLDLLSFLAKESFNLDNLDVLDLGCGSGLLGIYALCHGGARHVHFQDYNAEVLELVTIPNVLLNIDETQPSEQKHLDKLKFFSGDWASLEEKLDSYDVILTSETIYCSENYSKLLNIFKTVLKKTGVIYVAAKQHYFGVGGNIRQFEQLLRHEKWETSVCFCSEEGVKREILKVTLPN